MISAPNLLSIHYQDYRQAKMRLQMSHAGNAVSLEALFHGTQPHFALRSEEQEMEYLRALTDAILQTVLDPADYNSDCVRHLVRELVANLVLGNIVELLADPYVIHMIICKLLESYDPLVDELEASGQFTSSEDLIMVDDPIDVTDGPEQKQERLASALQEAQATDMSDEQQLSTSSPAAQQQQSTPPLEKEAESLPSHMQRLQEKRRQQGDELVDAGRDELDGAKAHERRHFSFIYITLQVMLAPIQTMWLYLTAILTSSQERYQQVAQHTKRTRHVRLLEPWMHFIRIAFLVDDRPVLQWTWSMVGMFLWPLVRVLGGGLLVDKFLEQTIMHFLGEDQLVFYLQLGRNLLWPDGQFIRKGEPVTAREKEQMRIRAERLLTVCFPGIMGKVVFEAANLDHLQSHIHDAIVPFISTNTSCFF
ncbi:hypothetical protein LRAMOSA09263 [Lichtheimia ramosa]|uniref:PXA domain-containing protein n=1 Tax=Lichtheimia ramosa TaxID=688394 RepID=A0A077WGI8_9FUNG|nr:hypothetical protein LRAMOSA09263 [Lichtheimia ramosa]